MSAVDYPIPDYLTSRPTKGHNAPCLIRYVYECVSNCPLARSDQRDSHRVSLMTKFLADSNNDKMKYKIVLIEPFALPSVGCPLKEIRIRLPFHIFVPDNKTRLGGGICAIGRKTSELGVSKRFDLSATLIDVSGNVMRPVPELVITFEKPLITAGCHYYIYGSPQLSSYEGFWIAD